MKIICPHCQTDWTNYAKNFPREPQAGDWAICLWCLKTCRFADNELLAVADENELPENVRKDVEIFRYMRQNTKIIHSPISGFH